MERYGEHEFGMLLPLESTHASVVDRRLRWSVLLSALTISALQEIPIIAKNDGPRFKGRLGTIMTRSIPITALALMFVTSVCTSPGEAAEPKAKVDSRDRSTAVALNYCKASFRRIQRYPSKRVLLEEQEKILNNLNLNGIADQEVIKLYGTVLDEIAQVQIADKEKKVFKEKHQRVFRQRVAASVFAMGTQFATAQYVTAMRTGASSWWDYRSMGYLQDVDIWKIEKQRLSAVVNKSSSFLDIFWKMARDKNIPDRWLIRDNDLDKLEEAMRETDPVVRLRILKRMEGFMECYPPYWYYVGRTQQALGQLFAAAETYDKVADLGTGHFRKDELLATSLANRAVIQDYLGQPSAPRTAREALGYASSVWEVNLMCAGLLQKDGQAEAAEDAILRNLDVDLEKRWSGTFLTWLYIENKQDEKLAKRLAEEANVRDLPAPLLLQSALLLGTDRTPRSVFARLIKTIYVYPDLHFGPDDLVLSTTSIWRVGQANPMLVFRNRAFSQPRQMTNRVGHTESRFQRVFEWGGPLAMVPEATLIAVRLNYPGMPSVQLHLRKLRRSMVVRSDVPFIKSRDDQNVDRLPIRHVFFEPIAFDIGKKRITLKPSRNLPPLVVKNDPTEEPANEPKNIVPGIPAPADFEPTVPEQTDAEPVTPEENDPDPVTPKPATEKTAAAKLPTLKTAEADIADKTDNAKSNESESPEDEPSEDAPSQDETPKDDVVPDQPENGDS